MLDFFPVALSLDKGFRNAMLSGVPFVTLVLELPGRFESVNGSSALNAGIRILPFTMTIALGSAVTGGLTARGRVPPIMLLFVATALQLLGMGLLYSIPAGTDVPARLYGYQVLAGLGVGLSLTTLLNIVPFVVEEKRVLGELSMPGAGSDKLTLAAAVAMGGVTQMRILGGAIGVSIATNLLNNTVKGRLEAVLSSGVISNILENVSSVRALSPSDQSLVQAAFADGYQKQLAMILGFCAAEVVALALMWEKPFRRLA
jgi:hypothetical protein